MKTASCLPLAFLVLTLGVAPVLPLPAAGAPLAALSIEPRYEAGELEIRHRDRRVLLYAFRTNQFKPYVKELYTLRGDNLLLDAPADHLHHHGLMYAITVNGHNFWEETSKAGYQVSASRPEASVGVAPGGRPQAALVHRLYWVPGPHATDAEARAAALLIEDRTLLVTVDEATEEVALQWRSDFTVGPATAKVKLSGSHYQGLGVRFIRAWDRAANHLNSEKHPYPTQGKNDVVEAQWAATTHTWNGRAATLALFARPAETRGPTRFFSMLDGFCYLSATQGLDKAPLDYAAGDRWTLRYLVAVYPALKSREFLQTRHAAWLKE